MIKKIKNKICDNSIKKIKRPILKRDRKMKYLILI